MLSSPRYARQRYLGEAATAPRYRLYDTGTYPALVEDPRGVSVRGEIWEVDDTCLRVLDAIEDVPSLYERREVEIAEPRTADVQTYVYRQDVTGMADCGDCWLEKDPAHRESLDPDQEPLYVVEAMTSSFAARRLTVNIVCAGDSLTGWNNLPQQATASLLCGGAPGAHRHPLAAARRAFWRRTAPQRGGRIAHRRRGLHGLGRRDS